MSNDVAESRADHTIAASPAEAARRLGVSRATIYGLLEHGQLRSVKVGRRRLIPVSELHRLVGDGGNR